MPVSLARVAGMPFRDYFLVHLNRRDMVLWGNARIGVAVAFGYDPTNLDSDEGLVKWVDKYLNEFLSPYVVQVAIPMLGLIDVGGTLATKDVASLLLVEAQKAKEKLFPVQKDADAIFDEDIRGWHFFSGVVASAAICCHQSQEFAQACGFKKTPLLGKWQSL